MTKDRISFYGTISSKKVYGTPPGIYWRRLTEMARDSTGKRWPPGTVFVALNGGWDNEVGEKFLDVLIVPDSDE